MTSKTNIKKPTRLVAVAALLGAWLGLTGCTSTPVPTQPPQTSIAQSPPPASTSSTQDVLTAHGLAGLDARQVIDQLDATPLAERSTDLIASVRPHELLISDNQQRETTLPIPDDLFYLSFAPYLEQTHECHFHSLTTCVGELQNVEVQVKVTNAAGEALVDEVLHTFDNGFVGVWLPRDIDATLTVEHDGHTASTAITTKGDEAATCLTTLQLR
jgi:hypothetical protein